ncbi:MAG TPA: ATP-binding protein [Dissulfurispiraceae bacterium]|nr:ATP-binding protein [Dissulfurispiraceae bacterium]
MNRNWKSLRNIKKMKALFSSLFRILPIAQKFTFSVALLILVIMVAVNALIITYQKNAIGEEMDSSHLIVIKNFAKDIVEPLMFLDPLKLDEHLQVVSQTPGCVYALITDRSGRVVAHSDRKMLGTVIERFAADKKPAGTPDLRESVTQSQDLSTQEIRVPVAVGYEQIGTVTAGFSRESMQVLINESLSGLEHYIVLISGILLILGISGSVLLARVLTTPMRQLKERMESVRSGGLDIAPVLPGANDSGRNNKFGDEIEELIETFNNMVIRLRESLDELEKSNREKARLERLSAIGEMSMTVAHEIKNPLNAIRGAVSYLKDNFEGEVLTEFLSIIEQETKRLNEIVTEYLLFSKPTPLKLRTADLNQAIADIVSLVRQEATENNIEMVTNLDESIKPFSFDLQQIKQALLNILVNALDASRPGDTIKTATVSREGHVDVIIEDTGKGIGDDILPEIFKPFYTTKTRGSGLGLACVERIVRDHRGEVSVYSMPGKGTRFIVSLPFKQES